eukprot:TRINITY_DN29439_c0_g1_i1.p2 TRINITY_DN29439_c0_g1~~TRINITY_DN29439_c0_g1_i1.p2  ORF type:complete len:214 (+),score=38.78 TRINITY_DN29439_c0_g1_i1:73-714(+)
MASNAALLAGVSCDFPNETLFWLDADYGDTYGTSATFLGILRPKEPLAKEQATTHFQQAQRPNEEAPGPQKARRRLSAAKLQLQQESIAASFAVGAHCSVNKHFRLGCAVVKFEFAAMQAAVLHHVGLHPDKMLAAWKVGDQDVTIRRHFDSTRNAYDPVGIFVSWGHQAEKRAAIPIDVIVNTFDILSELCLPSYVHDVLAPSAEDVPDTCL